MMTNRCDHHDMFQGYKQMPAPDGDRHLSKHYFKFEGVRRTLKVMFL